MEKKETHLLHLNQVSEMRRRVSPKRNVEERKPVDRDRESPRLSRL
jgi:hypothetical protein